MRRRRTSRRRVSKGGGGARGGGFLFLCFEGLVAWPFDPLGTTYTFHEMAGDSPLWGKGMGVCGCR